MKNITNLYRYIVSFFVGIAIIIPGLSGGTILAATNTLEDITTSGVEMITQKDKKKFINILIYVSGILVGIVLAAFLIKDMMDNFEWQTLSVFLIFIIISSVWFIKDNKINLKSSTLMITFILSTLGLWFLSEIGESTNTLVILSLFAGAIAGLSMLLPGLSGSLFLLVFGKYYLITDNIANGEIFNLDFMLFVAGIIIGTIITALTLVKLFKTHASKVNEISLGLILASAIIIIKGIITNL